MIEKIMRAVKSNNKKRGRNITIGAVVGMLLSCSSVMGFTIGNKNVISESTFIGNYIIGNENIFTRNIFIGDKDYTITFGDKNILNENIINGSGNFNIILGNENTINGNLTLGDGNDILTLGNGTIINGSLSGGNGDNTLNLGAIINSKVSKNDKINIFHNISDFKKVNININVTFYEKNIAITGVDNLTIGKGGVLILKIDSINKENGKIKGHALYGNKGTITSEGGKLLLALNRAGNKNIINFNKTTLDGSLATKDEAGDEASITLDTTSKLHTVKKLNNNEVLVVAIWNLPDYLKYPQLNKIYHGILSVDDLIKNFNVDDDEKLSIFLAYLNGIYTESPYSYSSELSRRSVGMFRDIVTENEFRPNQDNWLIMGGLTHADGGTKDTYYGKNYYKIDSGSSTTNADMKLTGAYMLAKYGYSENLSLGLTLGGNKSEAKLSMSKVKGNSGYLGAFAENYRGNLTLKAGAGVQYSEYDADRSTLGGHSYSDKYSDMTYDIYLNGRYSHQVGDNLFLEPYATLSYTYTDQDGANDGNKALAIDTDSQSFEYTVGKVGVDLKKVIPHSNGKSTLTAGVSYTKILDGAEEEYITGRFKGGSDFDILVAHKNEHSIGLNAKYALELENGVLFDIKGTYSIERDSHNGSAKNKTKAEWIAGAGMGYKF